MLKKLLLITLVSGLLSPIAQIANPAYAVDCSALGVQLFFWHGVVIDEADLDVTSPVAANSATFTCREVAGVTIDGLWVYPGATFVSGRDNSQTCQDISGTIKGLGVDDTQVWRKSTSARDGACSIAIGPVSFFSAGSCVSVAVREEGRCTTEAGTRGASSTIVPMDPTLQGTITGSTSRGSNTYRTLDELN